MTFLGGFIRDLFRGENVTSIWGIKRSRMEEAGGYLPYQLVIAGFLKPSTVSPAIVHHLRESNLAGFQRSNPR